MKLSREDHLAVWDDSQGIRQTPIQGTLRQRLAFAEACFADRPSANLPFDSSISPSNDRLGTTLQLVSRNYPRPVD